MPSLRLAGALAMEPAGHLAEYGVDALTLVASIPMIAGIALALRVGARLRRGTPLPLISATLLLAGLGYAVSGSLGDQHPKTKGFDMNGHESGGQKKLVKGFNHTSYTISDDDFDRIIGFLTDGLGFPLLEKGPRDPQNMEQVVGVKGADVIIAYVQAPGHRLELINYLKPDDRRCLSDARPCDTGFTHLAFDVYDIDSALAVARGYGFHPVNQPLPVSAGPNHGNFCVYTRDRNGITVEFIGPRLK